jgi:uncharacterized protein YecE (DUF72 family)
MRNDYIGSSGFVYPEWKGNFYPSTLSREKWLNYYGTQFNTVELNGTFYRFPKVKNLKKFYSETPDDFKFSVKANKIITHTLRMKNAKNKAKEFIEIVQEGLKEKLACILFQLPPSFRYNDENLGFVLNTVPAGSGSVVEFRDASWWTRVVHHEFMKHGITFCNTDYPNLPDKLFSTTELFYMRFHGHPVLYKSEYSLDELKRFTNRIPGECKKLFIYFNNTWYAGAVKNARSIKQILSQNEILA